MYNFPHNIRNNHERKWLSIVWPNNVDEREQSMWGWSVQSDTKFFVFLDKISDDLNKLGEISSGDLDKSLSWNVINSGLTILLCS